MNDVSNASAAPNNRWLKARNVARAVCFLSFCAVVLSSVVLFPTLYFFPKHPIIDFLAFIHMFVFASFLVSLGAWLLIVYVAYFKFRFSLRSLLIAFMGIGACGALFTGSLGNVGIGIGALLAFLLVLLGLFWVASYDPPDPRNRASIEMTKPGPKLPSIFFESNATDSNKER